MTRTWGLVLGVVISLGSAHAGELVDLTKVDRVIAKEPKYQNQPRYALLVAEILSISVTLLYWRLYHSVEVVRTVSGTHEDQASQG